MSKTSVEYIKNIPVSYSYDVAVMGAGIAGICAACEAADNRADVILIEQYATVGGNATVGGVAAFCGNTRGQGRIFDEIIEELSHYNAIGPYVEDFTLPRVFDHEILAVIFQEMLLKRGIKLLLHVRLIDAICNDKTTSYALIAGKSGIEAVSAKIFIDCTGDGDLADFSGCKSLNELENNDMKLPMSLMYFVRHLNDEEADKKKVPPDRFNSITKKEDLPMTSVWPNGPHSNAIKIKIPCFDAANTESLSLGEIRARQRMMEVLSYHQNIENKKIMLDHYPTQIGIREGRRILGEYVLRVDELRAACTFEDAIAVGTFYLDGHKPDDDKRTYILSYKEMMIPPYQIPFRCLIVKDSDNMLTAGRCFSCDQLTLSSARVMTTCAMMGQAAGLAAALCVKRNITLREIKGSELRQILTDEGAEMDVQKLAASQLSLKKK